MRNVRDAITQIRSFGGFTKGNRFAVEFPVVAGLPLTGEGNQRLAFNVSAATIPGRSVSTSDTQYYSLIRKMGYQRTFTHETTMTFRCSSDMLEKKFIDAWHDLIVNRITNDFRFYDSYVGDVIMHVMSDQDDRTRYAVKLYEAYPVSVGELQMDSTNGDILTFDVTFAFYKSEQVTDYVDLVKSLQSGASYLFSRFGLLQGTQELQALNGRAQRGFTPLNTRNSINFPSYNLPGGTESRGLTPNFVPSQLVPSQGLQNTLRNAYQFGNELRGRGGNFVDAGRTVLTYLP